MGEGNSDDSSRRGQCGDNWGSLVQGLSKNNQETNAKLTDVVGGGAGAVVLGTTIEVEVVDRVVEEVVDDDDTTEDG